MPDMYAAVSWQKTSFDATDVSVEGPFDSYMAAEEWIRTKGVIALPLASWYARKINSPELLVKTFTCEFCGKSIADCNKKNDCTLL